MSDLHIREHSIDTAKGKLFAQEWTPLQAQGAPIVLLHDLLGCVALWHPERLVALAGGPAAMQLLQGCGHVPHREQAEAVLTEVVRFLR